MHGFFGALYPIYVREQAYLVMNEGAKAAAEFQKILDHGGIVVSDPIGALSHLQLGRPYALLGDKTKARSAYLQFLTLWKDADTDTSTLQQAKREYGRLNGASPSAHSLVSHTTKFSRRIPMSLSPRPEMFTITTSDLLIFGARLMHSATACADSSAGMIPSRCAS